MRRLLNGGKFCMQAIEKRMSKEWEAKKCDERKCPSTLTSYLNENFSAIVSVPFALISNNEYLEESAEKQKRPRKSETVYWQQMSVQPNHALDDYPRKIFSRLWPWPCSKSSSVVCSVCSVRSNAVNRSFQGKPIDWKRWRAIVQTRAESRSVLWLSGWSEPSSSIDSANVFLSTSFRSNKSR